MQGRNGVGHPVGNVGRALTVGEKVRKEVEEGGDWREIDNLLGGTGEIRELRIKCASRSKSEMFSAAVGRFGSAEGQCGDQEQK